MIGYNESGLVFLPEFNKMSNVLSVARSLIAVGLMKFGTLNPDIADLEARLMQFEK